MENINLKDKVIKTLLSEEICEETKIYLTSKTEEDFVDYITNCGRFDHAFKNEYKTERDLSEIFWISEEFKIKSSYSDYKTVNTYFFNISRELFCTKSKNKILVNFDNYFDWVGFTHKAHQDVYAAIYGSRYSIQKDWLTNIKHNNNQINKIIEDEMCESHSHLKATFNNYLLSLYTFTNTNPEKIPDYFKKLVEHNGKKFGTYIDEADLIFANYIKKTMNEHFFKKISKSQINKRRYKLKEVFKDPKFKSLLINNHLINGYELVNYLEKLKEENISSKYTKYTNDSIDFKNMYNDLKKDIKNIEKVNYNNQKNDLEKKSISNDEYIDLFLNNKDINKLMCDEYNFIYKFSKLIHDTKDPFFDALLMYYLQVTTNLRMFYIQSKNYSGFDIFKQIEELKGTAIAVKGQAYFLLSLMSYRYESGVRYLEYRTTPSKVSEYSKQLNDLQEIADLFGIKLANVIHFIKSEKPKDMKKRTKTLNNIQTRNGVLKKQEFIFKAVTNSFKNNIIGIDTANYEISARPEIYGALYRRIKYDEKINNHNFKFTYHVGEVYSTLISGLRAVDEAVNYLALNEGDRLGHAVCLGIDPYKYYKLKKYKIYTTKLDILDNFVWMYYYLIKIKYEDRQFIDSLKIEIERRLSSLGSKIKEIMQKNTFDNETFNMSNFLYATLISDISIESYYGSMQLRSDKPDLYKNEIELIKPLKNEEVKKIIKRNYYDYHIYGENYFDYFKKVECRMLNHFYLYDEKYNNFMYCNDVVTIDEDIIKAVEYIQDTLIDNLDTIGISIETNPTSNYIITDIKRYDEHPLFKFVNVDDFSNKTNIGISVNTDDAAVFNTSIYKEYSIIASVLKTMKNDNGSTKYNTYQIDSYIKHLKELSERSSWVKGENK